MGTYTSCTMLWICKCVEQCSFQLIIPPTLPLLSLCLRDWKRAVMCKDGNWSGGMKGRSRVGKRDRRERRGVGGNELKTAWLHPFADPGIADLAPIHLAAISLSCWTQKIRWRPAAPSLTPLQELTAFSQIPWSARKRGTPTTWPAPFRYGNSGTSPTLRLPLSPTSKLDVVSRKSLTAVLQVRSPRIRSISTSRVKQLNTSYSLDSWVTSR